MPDHEDGKLEPFLSKLSDTLEKMRRIEGRVASDQDLKLSDILRYHQRDTQAAKNLLYRRLRCLADYENANKSLDKARARNKVRRMRKSTFFPFVHRREKKEDFQYSVVNTSLNWILLTLCTVCLVLSFLSPAGCGFGRERPAGGVHPVRNDFSESQRRVEYPPGPTGRKLPEESHRARRARTQTFQSSRTNAKDHHCQSQDGSVAMEEADSRRSRAQSRMRGRRRRQSSPFCWRSIERSWTCFLLSGIRVSRFPSRGRLRNRYKKVCLWWSEKIFVRKMFGTYF